MYDSVKTVRISATPLSTIVKPRNALNKGLQEAIYLRNLLTDWFSSSYKSFYKTLNEPK